MICLLAVSCSVNKMETMDAIPSEDGVFYASMESYSASDTKVYVDKENKSMIFWDEKDQISIFNKSTLNQKYEFLGDTGDNSGYFKKVSTESGGNPVDFVCAVYPYKKATSLDDSGVLTLKLPDKQTYREGSFGLEANTMVSTNEGKENLLRFKNVGGYLVFKFYGQGPEGANISISSIKLEGRNGELLSGEATMTPVIDENPTINMVSTAGTSITLECSKAVKLGKTENKATLFWVVVPPTTFSQGIKVTVTDKDGKVFVRESDVVLSIERNHVSQLSAIEVTPDVFLAPNRVIYYSTSDNVAISPNENADFGSSFVDSYYSEANKLCVMVFDGDVTKIGNNAFEECETLTDIMIPETVETIGDHAFAGCTSLGGYIPPSSTTSKAPAKAPSSSGEATIVIPEGVTSIGAYAFENCTSLTSITIPATVTSIGEGAFSGCESLSDIVIPDSVTDMGDKVFDGCINLTSVTIPEGVTSIDDYAFAMCENLTEVIIPESVTSIGEYAFYMCSNLTSIDIPSTVTTIGQHAFDDCESLVSITIPDGVKVIEPFTFAACMSLTKIKIPDGVKRIGNSAFESCFKLANVTLPSSVEYLGSYAFAQCFSFTTFTIPPKVTQISAGLFNDCNQLSRVKIHGNVESIGYGAFFQCTSLTSICIPGSVTCIEDQVFNGCTGLIAIIMEAIDPPVTENEMEYAFVNTNDCPIFVPEGSVNAYNEANGWSQYASRIYPIYFQTGTINDHVFMDLGAGAKWATMNVGATSSVEPGVILPWSEGKAAAEEWGGSWRLPTREELDTLMDESKFIWTLDFANNGYIITSKIEGYMGNSIFLPFADAYDPDDPDWNLPGTGFFWSSTLADGGFHYYLEIDDADVPFVGGGSHTLYFSIRPVAD